jgi:SpoVK/Ycf46/Vps4 family AAA+-type ATPase
LFGKRGDTRSANDRHANQQIAYLLQRIEECPGVVILASNLKANIDAAFARRFQAMVYFPMPDAAARRTLWEQAFAAVPDARLESRDFGAVARDYELSGGSIVNVLRHACTQAAARDSKVRAADLLAAIRREALKEGRHPI